MVISIHRRGFCALMALGLPLAGQAQSYPAQAIRLIVPWPPGGSADAVGRQVAQVLAAGLGQGTVVVDNIAGASGNIGTGTMARAAADGYTLVLATSSTNAAGPSLYSKLPFHPVNDFAPISLVSAAPSVLIVSASSPYRSVRDLVDAARARPGKLSYGSGGNGNSGHLSAALFCSHYGIEASHIPYKGNTPALTDLLGGQIDFMFDNNPVAMARAGKVRALATTGEHRMAALPEVMSFAEMGAPAIQLTTWFGLAAPRGTPAAVIDRLQVALVDGLKKVDAARRLQDLGMDIRTNTPAEFQLFWKTEIERYRGLVKLSGAKTE